MVPRTRSAVGRAPPGLSCPSDHGQLRVAPSLRPAPLLQGEGTAPAASHAAARSGPCTLATALPVCGQTGRQRGARTPSTPSLSVDSTGRRPHSLQVAKPGSGGSADLAEVLHGAPDVQQQVFGGAQGLVHRELQEGSPQLPLDPLVQERECALALALALTLALAGVGHLQQGTEGGGWGVQRGRAARRLQRLGDSRGGKRKDSSAPGEKGTGCYNRDRATRTQRDVSQKSPTDTKIYVSLQHFIQVKSQHAQSHVFS